MHYIVDKVEFLYRTPGRSPSRQTISNSRRPNIIDILILLFLFYRTREVF